MSVLDYGMLLEGLDGGSVAWLANRLTNQPGGTSWPNREAAIQAALDTTDELPEGHPRKELLYRYFTWGLGNREVP